VVDEVSVRGPMGGMEALAVTAAVLALLAGAVPARAQCEAATEGEKVLLMMKVRDEIFELETIKRQIEVERHVLSIYPGGVVLITPQQAGTLFGYAVASGNMDPDSIQPRIDDLLAITKVYLNDHILPDIKNKNECLERLVRSTPTGRVATSPASPSSGASATEWPTPMNWIAVRGSVRGSFLAECAGRPSTGYPTLKVTGPFRLDLLGNGRVEGSFGEPYAVTGEIKADGMASGDARSSDPESYYLRWSARFERSGSDLVMPSHTLDIMSAVRGQYAILVDCKPGYMRQEQ
jgi:hypothetical protein